MYVSPQLRPLVRALRAGLPACRHPWARALAFVLASRIILAVPLPRRIGGFTMPLLPVILMNRRWMAEMLPEHGALQTFRGRLMNGGVCEVAQVLLHECAHQLWAIWPEWKHWLRLLFGVLPPMRRSRVYGWASRIYGVDCNSADAVSEALARELCTQSRYHSEAISYRSPLAWLHPVFRRGEPGPEREPGP